MNNTRQDVRKPRVELKKGLPRARSQRDREKHIHHAARQTESATSSVNIPRIDAEPQQITQLCIPSSSLHTHHAPCNNRAMAAGVADSMECDRLGCADTERGRIRKHVSVEHISISTSGLSAYGHGYCMSGTAA